MNNDSGREPFAFHIPPESLFTSLRNPYSPFPGTLIHMPRNTHKRSFLDVSADIIEHVDPIFYGDPKTAAMKVLGLT